MSKIAFVIPFKPKQASSNWAVDNDLLKRTIYSVLNQTDQNFIVYVVTSDNLEFEIDHPNFKLLYYKYRQFSVQEVKDIVIPRRYYKDGHILKILDKCRRIHVAIDQARIANYDYIMALDADDLISNRIVDLISKKNSSKNLGWYMQKGYIYREGTKYMLKRDNMYKVCAGTYILRTDLIKRPRENEIFFKDYDLFHSHGYLKSYINKTYNQDLVKIDFPGIIYVAHSSNLGSINEKLKGKFFKNFVKAIIYGKLISKHIKKEFNFYKLRD